MHAHFLISQPEAQLQTVQEDWIGLRALDDAGRLVLDEIPGGHMRFKLSWFQSNIIVPYLS